LVLILRSECSRPTALTPEAVSSYGGNFNAGRLQPSSLIFRRAWRHARQRITEVGCRVPNAHLEACRSKLHEEAQTRIARAGGGRWRRKDLESVVRADEGYLASAPELEHYVHPTNWSDLRATMARDLAAIIIGQSGTGKALATSMLCDELRKEVNGSAPERQWDRHLLSSARRGGMMRTLERHRQTVRQTQRQLIDLLVSDPRRDMGRGGSSSHRRPLDFGRRHHADPAKP
jgi:hypothetical protein